MKRLLYIICFASLLTWGSCSKQDGDHGRNPAGQEVTEITATVPDLIESCETKSNLSQGSIFSWTQYDKLGFIPEASATHPESNQQAMFYVTDISQDGKDARFIGNGWGMIRGKRYYSYYPYDANSSCTAVAVHYNGQTQTANSNSNHLGGFDYLHACVDVPNTGDNDISYKRIGCTAKITLTIPQSYRSAHFTNLTLTSSENIFMISGQYNPCQQYPLRGSRNQAETVTFTGRTMSNNISLALGSGNGITCDGNGQLLVYIMMSPAQWNAKNISVQLDGFDGTVSNSLQLTGAFTPNTNQAAGVCYNHSATLTSSSSCTDLSENGTANCYIVTSAGEYRFRCDIKGNGVSVGGKSTSIGTPVCAYVLWETVNTTSAPARGSIVSNVEYRYENGHGYIYFTKPNNTAGNAAIVLLDVTPKFDGQYSHNSCYSSNGHTLWLWHIWCPGEQPGDDNYVTKVLMDRNLGALSKASNNPLSMGMLYQWGRPDPLSGAASFNNNTLFNALFDIHISPYIQSASIPNMVEGSGPHNINTVISFPLQYFTGTVNGVLNWSNEDQTELWGSDKTMYDPCPPGYKVPSDFSGFEIQTSTINSYGGNIRYNNGSATSSYHFWPMTGMRGLAQGTSVLSNVGTDAQYWTSHAYYHSSLHQYVGNDLTFHTDGGFSNNEVSYVITGNPVRCQKIQ